MTELLVTGNNGGVSGENRVMVGYFGNPAHHVASFAISGIPTAFQTNQLVTVVGQTVATSPTEIQVVFNTNGLRCDTGQNQQPCDLSYNLAAAVDGVPLCATSGAPFYGKVHRAF